MEARIVQAARAWGEVNGFRGTGPGNRIIVGPDGAGVAVTWPQFAQFHQAEAAAFLAAKPVREPRQPRSLDAAGARAERRTVAPELVPGMRLRGQGRKGSAVSWATYDPAGDAAFPWLLEDDGLRYPSVTALTKGAGSKWQGWAFWTVAGDISDGSTAQPDYGEPRPGRAEEFGAVDDVPEASVKPARKPRARKPKAA